MREAGPVSVWLATQMVERVLGRRSPMATARVAAAARLGRTKARKALRVLLAEGAVQRVRVKDHGPNGQALGADGGFAWLLA